MQSRNPPGHAQAPALQTIPAPQALPQPPQFVGSDEVLVQTAGLPHANEFCGQTHLPLAQMVPPVQAKPHPPQLATSVCVLRHAPVQAVEILASAHAGASACRANLVRSARRRTSAAMLRIALRIRADSVAKHTAVRARTDAVAARLAAGANHTACAAVVRVTLHVDARAAAIELLRRASGRGTFACQASFACAALRAASATVLEVGERVDAPTCAKRLPSGAAAFSGVADLVDRTGGSAPAAVVPIALGVDAATAAFDERRGARRLASARTTDLVRTAGDPPRRSWPGWSRD